VYDLGQSGDREKNAVYSSAICAQPATAFSGRRSKQAVPSHTLPGENEMKLLAFCVTTLVAASMPAFAFDPAAVPAPKRTKLGQYFSAQEAAVFLSKSGSKALFLDVRTPAETMFVGMPTMADANVPYMVEPDFPAWDEAKATLKLESNSDFVTEVRRRLSSKNLSADSTIVLICRSGDRSAAAANLLAEAGFKNVYSVVDGFEGDLAKDGPRAGQRVVNGWKNASLPWSYTLDKQKMYKIDK
jgi:rhodanese-related sulfurtransferase